MPTLHGHILHYIICHLLCIIICVFPSQCQNQGKWFEARRGKFRELYLRNKKSQVTFVSSCVYYTKN